GQRPYPAAMSRDHPCGGGLLGIDRPPKHVAGVVAAKEDLLLAVKGQGADPALVANQFRLLAGRQLPALNRIVLGTGENEAALRLEAAADQRTRVRELLRL